MDSKNKFWRGVMVGVLVTALVCLITVGASAGIYMFGRRVIDNQTQVQVQTEGTPVSYTHLRAHETVLAGADTGYYR